MNFLLIDIRDWRNGTPVKGSRVQDVQEAIRRGNLIATVVQKEEVYGCDHCRNFDAFVVHCSTNQLDIVGFLERHCSDKPVLGYAVGSPADDTRMFLKSGPERALLSIRGSHKPYLPRITRWVSSIRQARGDPAAIKRACELATGFDEELENQLSELGKDLISGVDHATLRKKRDSYPKLGISC